MTSTNLLSLAFLEDKPKAAAAIIQEFDPEQAVELFEKTPKEIVIPVIDNMSSWPATRILSLLSGKTAAGILNGLPSIEAETLLRLMSNEKRRKILSHMNESVAKSFAQKLVFPKNTVGAWMDSSIQYFTTDNTVNDCLDLIKRQKSKLNGVIIVVDSRRKLVGLIQLEELLISDNNQSLVNLLNKEVLPLSARATLLEVESNQAWAEYPTLPVVDRYNTLLGALSHHTLQVGETKPAHTLSNAHTFSLTAHMGNAFLIAVAGLMRLISSKSSAPAEPIPLPQATKPARSASKRSKK